MTNELAGYCILAVVTEAEKIAFKNRLKLAAQQLIEQRIAAAKTLINNAQEAANSEVRRGSLALRNQPVGGLLDAVMQKAIVAILEKDDLGPFSRGER